MNTGQAQCWCGTAAAEEIGPHYRRCGGCGGAVVAVLPGPEHFQVSDDEMGFYGKAYWSEYQRARAFPDIFDRARSDLSERCVFWLERVLEIVRPPGRSLEIGCGHGGFVRLMQELGFDAMGVELSPWVVELARRTFDVNVLQGTVDKLVLKAGFRCIMAFDVLEHLPDPLGMMRRCRDLLADDGVLLLQTPWYRGDGPDWSMFQEKEHIYLFTDESIRLLLQRAGFSAVDVRPSLFPYDMWVAAVLRGSVPTAPSGAENDGWRLPSAFRALLDIAEQLRSTREMLVVSEADRAARLEVIRTLEARIEWIERSATWRLYRSIRSLLDRGKRRT